MFDVISESDRDAFAREAFAAIETVLDRRCPESRIAFWAAVARLYVRDPPARSSAPCGIEAGPGGSDVGAAGIGMALRT